MSARRALVTGGGRGIGRAIAVALAERGIELVITGRSRAELDSVAAETRAQVIVADLADRAATDGLIAALPTIDLLINNAGIADSAPLKKTTDAMWDRIFEINSTAPFRLCRALAPLMAARGWGRIINIASNAGVSGYAYTAAYCAAKHALVGLTRALAVELATTGVTVNAVCPGWVDTQMVEDATTRIAARTQRDANDAKQILANMSPQNRLLDAREVAHLVAMLCDDDARGINGQALVIDGGAIQK